MIVPREHGAWGLLLVPLFSGIAIGARSAQAIVSLLLFILAALALFWLRTPVENLLGTSPLRAQTRAERQIASLTSVLLAVLSSACLTALLRNGRNPELWRLGAVVALALMAQMLLKRMSKRLRMAAQMAGAIGLTCTAPAAYYVATGSLNQTAFTLWAANWLFAADQIHYVQLRIHAARAGTFQEKLARGWVFLLGQTIMLALLIVAAALHRMPPLVLLAFLPAVLRGTFWFIRPSGPLKVKQLGWSELVQGIVFGILLAIGFCS